MALHYTECLDRTSRITSVRQIYPLAVMIKTSMAEPEIRQLASRLESSLGPLLDLPLARDEELSAIWENYHQMRDLLRVYAE